MSLITNTVVPGIKGRLRRAAATKGGSYFQKGKKKVTVFIDQKFIYILFRVTDIFLHMISLHCGQLLLVISISRMACLSISIGILRGPTEAATIPLSLLVSRTAP